MKLLLLKYALTISSFFVLNFAFSQSCSDGIQNGDETGIDCGGTLCVPCPVPCNVTATYQAPTPLNCNGGEVILTAVGQGSSYPAINNDFDGGSAGPGWSSNVTAMYNNPCDPSIDGGTYMWMGNSSPHPRVLETVDLDLSCGGTVCFYLDFATQSQASPCEGIDLANEGVYLEYSTNGGVTWTTIEYFGPAGVGNNTNSGGTNPQMTSWNQYCFDLPPGAFSAATRLHWAQTGSSGNGNDHWGIDNVTVLTPLSCLIPYYFDYTEIPGSPNNASESVVLTSDSTFNVIYTNGTDSCATTVNIVLPPCVCPVATITGGGPYCTGDSIPAVVFTVVDGLYPIVLEYAIDGVTQPPLTFSNTGDTLLLPAEGDYTLVSVSDANSCVGVISANTVTVTENTIPVYTDMIGGGTYCAGDQVSPIQVSATNASPLTVSYTLSGNPMTQTGSSPVSIGNGAGTYIVTSVSNGVCSVPVADTQVIVVNPMPFAVASVLQNPICQGDTLYLNGSPTTGTSTWVGPNGFTSILEDPSIPNAQPLATGSYLYIVNENNCIDTANINVIVKPNPIVNAGADFTICQDSVVTLTATGATTYSWNNGITNGVPFAANSTTTYVVTGTTNGCSATDTITITVLPPVIADGFSSINSGYEPLLVQFSNLSSNATTYNWNYGDGYTYPVNNTSGVEHLYVTPGNYYVTLTASNGYCEDVWMDSIVVIPFPDIIINIPNVFTPSQDGVNDIYYFDVQYVVSFEATIVNRWGNVVARITQPNAGWDGYVNGKLAEDGVYFVTYKATGQNLKIQEGQTFFHLIAK